MKYVYYKTHHGDLNTAFLMEAAGCIASNKEVKKLLEECVSKFRLYDSIKMEDFIEFVKDKKIIGTAYGKKTYPVLDVLISGGYFKRYIDYGIKSGDVLKKGNKPTEKLAGDIQAFVKNNIALYKYPRWIEFAKDLPKTDTGKIQR